MPESAEQSVVQGPGHPRPADADLRRALHETGRGHQRVHLQGRRANPPLWVTEWSAFDVSSVCVRLMVDQQLKPQLDAPAWVRSRVLLISWNEAR